MFGEEFLERVDPEQQPSLSAERTETVESSTTVLKARGDLPIK